MNEFRNISTLIFDLGGVLVDLDWDRCTKEFKLLGIEKISEILSTTIQTGFILDYERGKTSTEQFRNSIKSLSNKTISDKQIDGAWESFLVGIPSKKLELLLELKKNYRIIMLSNTNPLSFEVCKASFFNQGEKTIDDYFDKCYLSYEMKLCKPNKEIFLQLLKEENTLPEHCLFLDDSTHNIETAKSLGIATKLIQPFSELRIKDIFG